jgi:type IV secretory pathway ATPase VirB11/archaellum biosynthesis ATPase
MSSSRTPRPGRPARPVRPSDVSTPTRPAPRRALPSAGIVITPTNVETLAPLLPRSLQIPSSAASSTPSRRRPRANTNSVAANSDTSISNASSSNASSSEASSSDAPAAAATTAGPGYPSLEDLFLAQLLTPSMTAYLREATKVVKPVKLLPGDPSAQRLFVSPVADIIWGPLTPYLADNKIDEIEVVDYNKIYVQDTSERHLKLVPEGFATKAAYQAWIKWLLSRLGVKKPDELVDLALPGGLHLTFTLLSETPWLTMRLPIRNNSSLEDLTQKQVLSSAMATYLQRLAQHRQSIIFAGGVATGKTLLLRAVLGKLAGTSAIVEGFPELFSDELDESRLRRFEVGPETSTAEAVRSAIYTTDCDRLVLGEIRDWSASRLVNYAAKANQVLTTIHANSVESTLNRLRSLVAQDQDQSPAYLEQTKKLAAQAFGLVVVCDRERLANDQVQVFIKEIACLNPDGSHEVIFSGELDPTGEKVIFTDHRDERS